MASARYALYTKRTRGKAVCVKTLSPTDANFAYHILRAHYQLMLWKAADKQTPPAVDIVAYGWELVSGAGCVCQLHALQEDQQLLLPTWTSSTANTKLSGKLAAVMHVAVILHSAFLHAILLYMCFNPFTKHDENEDIHDNEDGGRRELERLGNNLFYDNVMGTIYRLNING